MPDSVVQTYCDSDSITGESMHPYQSMWISHWMQTSCNSASRVHNQFFLHDERRGKDCDSKQGAVIAQITEPRKAKRLAIDGNPCNVSEYRNAWRCQEGDMVVSSDVPESAKAVGAVAEARRVEITNETLVMNSGISRNARSKLQSFEVFNINKNMENILAQKEDLVCDKHASTAQTDYNSEYGTVGASKSHFPSRVPRLGHIGTEFPLNEYHSQPKSISQSPGQWVKPCRSLDVNVFPVLGPFQDDLTGSKSDFVPYGIKSGGAFRSFMRGKGEIDQSSSPVASREHFANTNCTHVDHEKCNNHGCSTFLVCEKKMDNQLVSQKSESSYSGPKCGALQLHDPSTSNLCFPISVGEQGKGKHGSSSTGCLANHSSPAGVSKLEEFYHGQYSLHRMPTCSIHGSSGTGRLPYNSGPAGVSKPGEFYPEQYSLHRMPTCSIHDVEKVQICTTVDSVEGVRGASPKFSQTTHHVLISNKNDVNLSEGKKMIRDSTGSTTLQGDAFHELLTLLPGFDSDGRCGLKLQFVGNSTNSEGKEDRDVKIGSLGLKGESSAETDTMDISVFWPRSSPLSMASSPSNKDVMVNQNPARSQARMVSPREKSGSRETETTLPDINHEPPAILASARSMENNDLSTSRTESLDVEHLLSHVEQAENSNSSPHQNSPLDPEPSSRWVKRLKLTASDSPAHGTQSMNIRDSPSSGKVSKLFSNDMNYRRPSFEPTLGGKGQTELDKATPLLGNKKSSSMRLVKEQRDLSLSRSWIQRLCHNRAPAPLMKPTTPIACEQQSSKLASDDFQRKQFPSIDAMALMGKAMSGFQACEFHKRGSIVVWNTMGL